MDKKFKDNLYTLLKNDSRLWSEGGKELNQTLLKDLVDKFDEKIIESLLGNAETKKQFFVKIKEAYVFKPSDFKFFLDENKIDNSFTQLANKIGLKIEDDKNDKVILNWPFKDCVLEGGMTKEDSTDVYFKYDKLSGEWTEEKTKRKEIFFNEVLARDEIDRLEEPKAFYKWERFTANGGEKVKEIKRDDKGLIRENFVIKGNNLLALHSLKEQFEGKIKLIYIDPPYNRDADVFYNDNFQRSSWLTFMRNRLDIAKDLLLDDGCIYISIDDKQYAYLKVLCDDIFKEENFITSICVRTSSINGLRTKNNKPTKVKDYLLLYAKNITKFKYNQQFEEDYNFDHYSLWLDKKGEKDPKKWRVLNVDDILKEKYKVKKINEISKEDIQNFILNNYKNIFSSQPVADRLDRIDFSKKDPDHVTVYVNPDGSETYMYKKRILDSLSNKFRQTNEGLKPMKLIGDLWTDISYTGIDKEGDVKLLGGKKPEKLLQRIIETITKKGDIVLDYHAGSGTSCAVAHKMDRQWIGVEQLDYSENNPEERMKGVIEGDKTGISKGVNWKGGGDFIYIQLAKWNEEAKVKITEAKSYEELVKLFGQLCDRYFLDYNVRVKDFKESVIKSEEFKKLSLTEQKKMFVRMLDLNQMYVNFSERNDKKYDLAKEDILLSEDFYKHK